MKYIKIELGLPDITRYTDEFEPIIKKELQTKLEELLPKYPLLRARIITDQRYRWDNPEDRL